MSAKPVLADVEGWASELDAAAALLGRHFARSEPRERATAYLRGLLSDIERKNGWQLAERAGDARPYGVQHLLGRADWSADDVRDELIRYAHRALADPRGVLVVDETGFLKKGTKSAGVARQYSGTAGRVENCQVGVFLAFAGRKGRALIDRALYLPKDWAADADRRKAAGVPAGTAFATKPRLAEAMVARALRLGVRAAWVTGDAVYGNDSAFRRYLERAGQPYVLAVQAGQRLWVGFEQRRVDALADELVAGAWHRASAGDGSKGPRWYDWAVTAHGPVDERGWQLWLLVRRHRERPGERAYYLCRGPADTAWPELVRAAGARWAVEECFERAKGTCGLDEYEVRSWAGWHRHVTLSLWALAVLAAVRVTAAGGRKRGARS
jgi:SRSO17 transposase